MIRRGLQITFVVGIMALGAAPVMAATNISLTFYDRPEWSGYYVAVASGGNPSTGARSSLLTYRYGPTGGQTFAVLFEWNENNDEVVIKGYIVSATDLSLNNLAWTGVVYSDEFETIDEIYFGAEGDGFYSEVVGFLNLSSAPVDVAFPDWGSAVIRIPLGFSFAMSFWAACVAASMSMKWVRDLASAAS